jgi:uncharacterized Rossmann fold enzyme
MNVNAHLIDVTPRGLRALPRQANTGDDRVLENIRANSLRGLTEFQPALVPNLTEIIIVGSGPSLDEQFENLKRDALEGRPVIAVKGAHDWMIDRGLVPDLYVSLDAQPEKVNCIQRKREEVGYLLASQCAPEVFDFVEEMQVVMWHAWAGIGEDQVLGENRLLVGGGSTSGLRAMTLAYLMGFRKVILYGFDSCLRGDVKRVNGDKAENAFPVFIGKDKKEFTCSGAMAAQAADFQQNWKIMPGLKVRVMGGGVLAAIMEERQRIGFQDSF